MDKTYNFFEQFVFDMDSNDDGKTSPATYPSSSRSLLPPSKLALAFKMMQKMMTITSLLIQKVITKMFLGTPACCCPS
jgi:hypothetical protein